MDILHNMLSERAQAIYDSIIFLVIFAPVFFFLLKHGFKYAAYSFEIRETSYLSYWQPYVYPIKIIIPLAFAMFALQSISEFIKNATFAIRNKPL